MTQIFEELKYDDFYDYVSKLIIRNVYICTFIAGAEIGPRSLGHRSIISSAKDKKISEILNEKIKGREDFRPLAPVLLEKDLTKFFKAKKSYQHNLTDGLT